MVQAEHSRIFIDHLPAFPHKSGHVRTDQRLALGIGIEDWNKCGRLRRRLRAKSGAWHETGKSLTQNLPITFIGSEEEGLIPDDGPTQNSSELI